LPKAIEAEVAKLVKLELDEKEQEKIQANFLDRNDKHITKYKETLARLFGKIRLEVLANISKAPKSTKVENWMFSRRVWEGRFSIASVEQGKQPIIDSGQYILDKLREHKDYSEANFKKVTTIMNRASKQPPDIPEGFEWTDEIEAWLLTNAKSLSKTAVSTLYKEVSEQLAVAIEEGLSIPKIKERLNELYGLSKAKAEQVARTEILKASNKGWIEGARQSGVVEGKQWLAYVDQRCCPECASMDGVTMALDTGFSTKGGEELFDYTGDALQHPPLHPDCRCTLVAIVKQL